MSYDRRFLSNMAANGCGDQTRRFIRVAMERIRKQALTGHVSDSNVLLIIAHLADRNARMPSAPVSCVLSCVSG